MNAVAAVANHLNILESAIVEIQEWASVLWVRFVSGRPRFVSKKVVKVIQMTRKQLAEKIANNLDCTSKVWAKSNKVRVYLSHRGKDYGFVEITANGVDWNLTSYANNAYGSAIRDSVEGIQILEPQEVIPGTRRLTESEAQLLAAQSSSADNRSDTEKALDAMYGKGGWDRWDREDYEG